nr:MAG TPA: putative transcriptional regulator [Caudoviricetes sp.]
MLDVSRAWLWDQVNAGHFPKPIKLGRLARYKAEDVERFLANQEQIAAINLMGE